MIRNTIDKWLAAALNLASGIFGGIFGLTLLFAPFMVIDFVLFPQTASFGDLGQFLLFAFCIVLGSALTGRAYSKLLFRYAARNSEEIINNVVSGEGQNAEFVLLLRGFNERCNYGYRFPRSIFGLREMVAVPGDFETRLTVTLLEIFQPIIKLGVDRSLDGMPGFSVASSDANWRKEVRKLLEASGAIFVVCGTGAGIREEVGEICRSSHLINKTVVIFPPTRLEEYSQSIVNTLRLKGANDEKIILPPSGGRGFAFFLNQIVSYSAKKGATTSLELHELDQREFSGAFELTGRVKHDQFVFLDILKSIASHPDYSGTYDFDELNNMDELLREAHGGST